MLSIEIQLSIITTILGIGVPVVMTIGGWMIKRDTERKKEFNEFKKRMYDKLDDLCNRVSHMEGAHSS